MADRCFSRPPETVDDCNVLLWKPTAEVCPNCTKWLGSWVRLRDTSSSGSRGSSNSRLEGDVATDLEINWVAGNDCTHKQANVQAGAGDCNQLHKHFAPSSRLWMNLSGTRLWMTRAWDHQIQGKATTGSD